MVDASAVLMGFEEMRRWGGGASGTMVAGCEKLGRLQVGTGI